MPSIRRTTKITVATPKPVKETREVTVLKRAEVKRASSAYFVNPGDVICLVRNGGGKVYTTILRRSKQHTCTCAGNALGHKQCYHIAHCKAQENARWEAEQAKAAHTVVEATSQAVVETKERDKVWDKDLCCEIWVDTRKPVDPEAYEAALKPQIEAYEREMTATAAKVVDLHGYVTERQAKREHKEALLAEARAIKAARQLEESPESAEKRRANANLGGTRAFSKLR